MNWQQYIYHQITTFVPPHELRDGQPLPMRRYKSPLPEGLQVIEAGLELKGYPFPLPSTVKKIEGNVLLSGYQFPLPEGLEEVAGWVDLQNYKLPLPSSMKRATGIYLNKYPLPLANGLVSVRLIDIASYSLPLPTWVYKIQPNLTLNDYRFPLPENLTEWRGSLGLRKYKFPLPARLSRIHGSVDINEYGHPLPGYLERVDGLITLRDYPHSLPERIRHVGGALFLGYEKPLPPGIEFLGSALGLDGYREPLPQGLRFLGDVDGLNKYRFSLPPHLVAIGSSEPVVLSKYKHPLPANLQEVRSSLVLKNYDFPLPETLRIVYGRLSLGGYKHPLPAGLRAAGSIDLGDYQFPMPVGMVAVAGVRAKPSAVNVPPVQDIYQDSGLLQSAAFRRWFKDSRAVDATGKPLILYHGTVTGGHSAFDSSRIDPHQVGFFFTNSIKVAGTYASNVEAAPDPVIYAGSKDFNGRFLRPQQRGEVRNEGVAGIYRVVLSMQNPFIANCRGGAWNNIKTPEYGGPNTTFEIAALAKRDGYDGVILRNLSDEGVYADHRAKPKTSDIYVVFHPSQIKSAYFNNGDFSSTDSDIRKNTGTPRRSRTSRAPRRSRTSRALRGPKTSRAKRRR
jgi:hypothetical protein